MVGTRISILYKTYKFLATHLAATSTSTALPTSSPKLLLNHPGIIQDIHEDQHFRNLLAKTYNLACQTITSSSCYITYKLICTFSINIHLHSPKTKGNGSQVLLPSEVDVWSWTHQKSTHMLKMVSWQK